MPSESLLGFDTFSVRKMTQLILNAIDAAERQLIAHAHTDSAERWLRQLVDISLKPVMGVNYITDGPWKNDIKRKVLVKLETEPGQFKRQIDATTFDQLIDIVLHPEHWAKFKDALSAAYPNGREEARTFLTRLQVIRNHVAHLRPCSTRQMEQALCYANDLADSIKAHYQAIGMSREFNVPTFVSYVDSLGNTGYFEQNEYHYRAEDLTTSMHRRLYPGDVLTAELEIDPSFDPSTYTVTWYIKTHPGDRGVGRKASITVTEAHIGLRMEVQFKLKTTNSWHRSSSGDDDVVDLYYRVLPLPP
ncbi:MAG: hypothetical protein IM485_02970 [Microcystis sp. M169S2]|nr:hypothetical protein [Microcystis sp. M169S2]